MLQGREGHRLVSFSFTRRMISSPPFQSPYGSIFPDYRLNLNSSACHSGLELPPPFSCCLSLAALLHTHPALLPGQSSLRSLGMPGSPQKLWFCSGHCLCPLTCPSPCFRVRLLHLPQDPAHLSFPKFFLIFSHHTHKKRGLCCFLFLSCSLKKIICYSTYFFSCTIFIYYVLGGGQIAHRSVVYPRPALFCVAERLTPARLEP